MLLMVTPARAGSRAVGAPVAVCGELRSPLGRSPSLGRLSAGYQGHKSQNSCDVLWQKARAKEKKRGG